LQFFQRGISLSLDLCCKTIARGLIKFERPARDFARRLITKLPHAPAPGRADLESFCDHCGGVAVVVSLKHALPKSFSISHDAIHSLKSLRAQAQECETRYVFAEDALAPIPFNGV